MAVLFSAINAHKNIEWFRKSVREVRVSSVEDWSDFTQFIKVWHFHLDRFIWRNGKHVTTAG